MWPEPGEALSRTIKAEQAIEDLYAEALRRWLPSATAVVLPALTAAALPPDPDAVAQTQSDWEHIGEQVIVAGLVALWAASYLEASDGLDLPLPDLPDRPASAPLDPEVARIVARATGHTPAVVEEQVQRVLSAPAVAEKAEAFAAQQRPVVAATPAVVQEKVAASIRDAGPSIPDGEPVPVQTQRAAAEDVMQPASPVMRDVARRQGYQAAGVMNNAVLEAARGSDEELQKVWICTLDGKTRPTHWAADGQRVPLEGTFTVGGEQLRFPGDETASPAEWKNCRCRMGVLAPDEPLPDEVDRHTERLNGRDSVAINREGRTQAEEIARRRAAGNVRARDAGGEGRVASVDVEQECAMTELAAVDVEPSVVDEPDPDFASAITALVAANASAEPRLRTYDPRLFDDPKLTGPTAPTMNNETGRIYGHLAEWGHTIRGGRDVTPRNRNGYLNFHTSQVQLDNGKQLSVGRLTVQGGHAPTDYGVTAAAARSHYDDVTTAFGLVRVGEDQYGIWFSGVPAPGVDPEVFQQGMTSPLSGDWRNCPGHPLDMIAAHAVNAPGFPIYSAVTGADGRDLALVASLGPVRRSAVTAAQTIDGDALRAAALEVVTEVLDERRRTAELAARRDAALTAAHAAVGDPPPPMTPADRIEEILAHTFLTAAVSTMPAQFKKYWLAGRGAASIRWGTDGDFNRCVRAINAKITEKHGKPLPDHEIKGLCSNLHREALGKNPGKN